jgi:hypothetical protein
MIFFLLLSNMYDINSMLKGIAEGFPENENYL